MKDHDGAPREFAPDLSLDRHEHLVRAIVERARPILAARRATRTGVLGIMARWRRPVLSASAGLIAAGLVVVFLTDDRATAAEPAHATVFPEALVPRPIAAWLGGGDEPDLLELMAAIAGVPR